MSGLDEAVDRLKREGYSSEEVKEALKKMKMDQYRNGKTYSSTEQMLEDLENDEDKNEDLK